MKQITMNGLFRSTLLVAGASVAPFAHAQVGVPLDENEAYEEGKLDGVDIISVYATRNPESSFDYAGQVSVIGREEILDFDPSTLADIFDAIPGATFDSGPRRTGDAPTVRGLGGDGVLIFLDGARQSFISGHDGRFFVDPELVQAVEVVRGPTSALYGSGALGGVIATRTLTARDVLEPDERYGFRINTGYQSVNDEYRIGGTGVWQSENGMFDLVGHLTYRDSGNIELGNGFELPADDEILSSLIKATFRPTDDVELYASYLRYDADSTDPQNPQDDNVAGPANDLVFRDAENNTVQGGVKWDPASPLIDFNAVAYYSENSVEEDEVDSPRLTDRAVETFGFSIDNRSTFSLADTTRLILTYGGEYYEDDQTGLDTESVDGTRGGVPDASTEFFGLFAQAELEFDDLGVIPGTLSLVPGLRWDSFDTQLDGGDGFDIDEDKVSGKIGVSYKPVPQLLIFGNYAEGFRAPSFNEAFADGVHFVIPNLTAPPGPRGPSFVSNLFIGNAALESEESDTFEIGAGLDFTDLLSRGDAFIIKGSYYDSDVDNLIGLDVNTPGGCFVPELVAIAPCGSGPDFGNFSQNINIANADIDGFELEFTYDADRFYVRGNYAAIDGMDADTGEFLEGVLSPDTFFVDGGVKFPKFGVRVGGRLTVADDFTEVNDPLDVREDFVTGDIYAVWEPNFAPLDGVRLDVGIDNIADTDFEVVNAGVSQPGRNYKVALSWSQGF